MFRTPNPYDELVVAGTAETLTDVNWEKFLEICDKVSDEGETGARNAISSILKRLAHRNPNVQTFALELTNSLSENCGKEVHREISSKSFTDGLERVITDRTTNDKVRTKVLGLIRKWNEVFKEGDEGEIMHELYDRLSKNSEYSQALTGSTISEPAPDEDAERARAAAEEAELQRVLELSKQETGGRGRNGGGYSNGAGGSSSSQAAAAPAGNGSSSSAGGGRTSSLPQQAAVAGASNAAHRASPAPPPAPVTPPLQQALRVRALYTYTPTNPTELAFEAGSVIKVIGRTYAEWWRGTLRGRVGIFPVNYVEALSAPSDDELRRERADEDEIFGRIARFDELLEKLRAVDVARDGGIPDDVEELYASCVGLQARLGGLIGKYAGYKADLETISNIFAQAAYSYQTMKNPQIAPPAPQMYAHPHQYSQQQFSAPVAEQTPPPPQQQQQAAPQEQPQQQQQQHPGTAAGAQAQPGQHLTPEWAAYYAQQAAAARGQAAQVPGQTPVPAQQQQQHAPAPHAVGSQDGHGVPFPAQQGGGGSPYAPHGGQDPYQQQQHPQPPYDAQQRHASQGSLQPQQQRPSVLSNASHPSSYGQQPHPSQSPQPYASSPSAGQQPPQQQQQQQQYAPPPEGAGAGGYLPPGGQPQQPYAYPEHRQ